MAFYLDTKIFINSADAMHPYLYVRHTTQTTKWRIVHLKRLTVA